MLKWIANRGIVAVCISLFFVRMLAAEMELELGAGQDKLIGRVQRVIYEESEVSEDINTNLDKIQEGWKESFIKKAKIEEWFDLEETYSQFSTNPFPWKGKIVGFLGEFYAMLSDDSGIFSFSRSKPFGSPRFLVMRKLSSTQFTKEGETAFFAARVQGMTQVSLPILGTTPIPELHLTTIEVPLPSSTWLQSAGVLKPRKHVATATYDGNGNIVEIVGGSQRFTHDPQGRLLDRQHYERDGTLFIKDHYAYDTRGTKAEVVRQRGDGVFITKSIETYDAKGNLVQTSVYQWGSSSPYLKFSYMYDAKGNRIEQMAEGSPGKLRYTYDSYDAIGNWVSRVKWNTDGKTNRVSVEYRKITYK